MCKMPIKEIMKTGDQEDHPKVCWTGVMSALAKISLLADTRRDKLRK